MRKTLFRVFVFVLALAAITVFSKDANAHGRWGGRYSSGEDSYLYSPGYLYGMRYTNSNFDAFGRSIYDAFGHPVPQTYSAYYSHQYRQSYQWYPQSH